MKRNRAAFTIVKNDRKYLDVWLDYYRRHFDLQDIYVLDHASHVHPPLTTQVIPVHNDRAFDHAWLRDTAAAFQRFLLQSYENVLFACVDEIVVPSPLSYPLGLGPYIEINTHPAVRCAGFDVVHRPGEPPINWAAPLLAQRSRMIRSPLYAKTPLAREPFTWTLGFHEPRGVTPVYDDQLLLIHLHRVDHSACLARHQDHARQAWNQADLDLGYGYQNRIHEQPQFDAWFYDDQLGTEEVEIPDHLKGVI